MPMNKRGSSTLESVLVIPLIISFMVASVDVVKIGYSWLLLCQTVERAAVWASGQDDEGRCPDLQSVRGRAEIAAADLGLESVEFTVTSFQYDWSALRGRSWIAYDGNWSGPGSNGSAGRSEDQVLVTGTARVRPMLRGLFHFVPEITVAARASGLVS